MKKRICKILCLLLSISVVFTTLLGAFSSITTSAATKKMMYFYLGGGSHHIATRARVFPGETYIFEYSIYCSLYEESTPCVRDDGNRGVTCNVTVLSEEKVGDYYKLVCEATIPDNYDKGSTAFFGVDLYSSSEGFIFDRTVYNKNDPNKTDCFEGNADFQSGLDKVALDMAFWGAVFTGDRGGVGLTKWQNEVNTLAVTDFSTETIAELIKLYNPDDGDWSNAPEFPVYDSVDDYLTYNIVNGGAVITDCETFVSGNVVLPEKIGGYPITTIADSAFANCTGITSIKIPNTVTSIGNLAFYDCKNMSGIQLPSSLVSLGDRAFAKCSNLTSLTLPETLETIGSMAFYESGLINITIPKNVSSIGSRAFLGSKSLAQVLVDSANEHYSNDVDGILYNKAKTELLLVPSANPVNEIKIPGSVVSIDESAFDNCKNLGKILIDNANTAFSVDSCGILYNNDKTELIYCPQNIKVTTLVIPKTVEAVAKFAFNNTKIIRIYIPNNVKLIDSGAFAGCLSLVNAYYCGTDSELNNVEIAAPNSPLFDAVWHYDICEDDKHVFTDVCDESCENCDWIRTEGLHSYLNPCDAICSLCGDEREMAHTFSSECDDTCDVCGITRIASEHKYDNNCDNECDFCGYIRNTYDHQYDNNCDSTCNECGYLRTTQHSYYAAYETDDTYHWYKCAVCGEVDNYGEHIFESDCDNECDICGLLRDASHEYENVCDAECDICGDLRVIEGHKGGTATCKKKAVCENCGEEYGNKSYTNHTGRLVQRNKVTATCSTEGYTGDTYCLDCNKMTAEGTVIPATEDHKYDNNCDTECNICGAARLITHEYKPATCTEPITCLSCKKTLGQPAGHKFSDATCTAPATCTVCSITEGVEKGHSFVTYNDNLDATCTEDGTKTAVCDNCDAEHTLTIQGSALGHSFTQYESDENAKCELDGTMTSVCDRCDETKTVTDEGSAIGHNWTDATCTEAKTCRVCGEIGEEALGHTFNGITGVCENCGITSCVVSGEHEYGQPTCTEPGKCTLCGRDNPYAIALGHSFTNYVSNNNATCTEDGTKTAKCERCDSTNTIIESGTAKGHSYAEAVTKAPTCTETGVKTFTCACGAMKTETIAATGAHTLVTITTKATYKAKGSIVTKCSVCGVVTGTKTIAKLVPKATKISKVTAAKKSLKIKIKKEKSVSGYEIQYSLKKNFKSAKKVTLKKNSLTTKTIKKLKARKTYYVRVRTFKTVGKKKYYSDWSKAVKKKTK